MDAMDGVSQCPPVGLRRVSSRRTTPWGAARATGSLGVWCDRRARRGGTVRPDPARAGQVLALPSARRPWSAGQSSCVQTLSRFPGLHGTRGWLSGDLSVTCVQVGLDSLGLCPGPMRQGSLALWYQVPQWSQAVKAGEFSSSRSRLAAHGEWRSSVSPPALKSGTCLVSLGWGQPGSPQGLLMWAAHGCMMALP